MPKKKERPLVAVRADKQTDVRKVLATWDRAKRALAQATDDERAWRDLVIRVLKANSPPHKVKQEGDTFYDVPGWQEIVVVENKLNRTVDTARLSEVIKAIGPALAKDLFLREPKLSLKAYRKLPPEAVKVVERTLITKPAMPSLSFETR